jgi:hypothetical protein
MLFHSLKERLPLKDGANLRTFFKLTKHFSKKMQFGAYFFHFLYKINIKLHIFRFLRNTFATFAVYQ